MPLIEGPDSRKCIARRLNKSDTDDYVQPGVGGQLVDSFRFSYPTIS